MTGSLNRQLDDQKDLKMMKNSIWENGKCNCCHRTGYFTLFLEAGTCSHLTSLCHTGRRAVEVINGKEDRSGTFLQILTGITKNSELSSV